MPEEAEAAPETAPTNGAAPPEEKGPDTAAQLETLTQQHRAHTVSAARQARELAHAKQQLEEANARPTADSVVSIEDLKSDPLAALGKLGITFDQLSQRVVDADKAPPSAETLDVREMKETIASLKEELGGVTQGAADRQLAERRSSRLTSMQSYTDGKEGLEVLHALGGHRGALAAIEQAESDGIPATNQEVIDSLLEHEQKIRGEVEPQIKALAAVPWARELFTSALKSAAEADGQSASKPGQPDTKKPDRKASKGRQPAVSNAVAAETSPPATDERKSMGQRERIDAAAAAVRRRRAERAAGS